MKSLLIIYFCIMGDPKCFSGTFSEIHTTIDSCSQAQEVVRHINKGDAKLFGRYPILIIKYECSQGI